VSGRLAIWSLSFAVSLAVHSGILMGLAGMARAPELPPAAELLVGDEAAFSSLAVSPIVAETSSAELIADSKPALSPNLAGETGIAARVESTAHASTEKATSQTLAPLDQASEHAPVTAGEAVSPIKGNTIAAESDAQAILPTSDHLRAAAESDEATKYSPAAQDHQLPVIAQHDAPFVPAPTLRAEEVRTQMQVAAAQEDAEQSAPLSSATIASEKVEASQLPMPNNESTRLQALPGSDSQLSQPPAQAIDIASSDTRLSANDSGVIVVSTPESGTQPVQPPAQAVHIASPEARLAAAGNSGTTVSESESYKQLSQPPAEAVGIASSETHLATADNGVAAVSVSGQDTSAALAPVATDQELKSPTAPVEQADSKERVAPLMPVAADHQVPVATMEDGRAESHTAAPSPRQPVQSGITEPAAPAPDGEVAAPVISEIQQPASSATLAMVAPHPAIVLPPTSVLPDDPSLRMANFIRDYNGGFCFFAVPRALDSPKPRIEGFGSRPDLIRLFGEAFRRALGVEPELGVRQITELQCPALGFVGTVLKSHIPEITVRLAADTIANGDELRGALDGIRLSHVSLLLVDDDGVVHDVSQYLRRTVDGLEFAAPIHLTGEGERRNQLIVSVAADRELGFMKTTKSSLSEGYFLSVIAQARSSGAEISVGLSAFQVE
jgi:hypothetical protein